MDARVHHERLILDSPRSSEATGREAAVASDVVGWVGAVSSTPAMKFAIRRSVKFHQHLRTHIASYMLSDTHRLVPSCLAAGCFATTRLRCSGRTRVVTPPPLAPRVFRSIHKMILGKSTQSLQIRATPFESLERKRRQISLMYFPDPLRALHG